MSETAQGYCEITLEPKLASQAAHGLYQRLMEHRGDTVVLDASKVEQLGVLCMQILVSACKSWNEKGGSFEIIDPSTAFRETAGGVGLDLSLMGVEQSGESDDDA